MSNMKFLLITPSIKNNLNDELLNCVNQINSNIKKRILSCTIFINSESDNEYYEKKLTLSILLQDHFQKNFFPISTISQPPVDGYEICMEFCYTENVNAKIERKIHNGYPYTLLTENDQNIIFVSGLSIRKKNQTIENLARACFKIAEEILHKESMDFRSIIRQWNYIENIFASVDHQQNYQIFNNVRAEYYNSSNLNNNFPSATGIGVNAGGITLDFIASKKTNNLKIISLNNPIQIDAHKYSNNVLIGKENICTPKFERAKYLKDINKEIIFISGTAAIIGENTEEYNAEQQTYVTIENIIELISHKNLKNHGINTIPMKPSFLRIYIKNREDISSIKKVCEEYFNRIPSIYLLADICRENLLVEIEGIAQFNEKFTVNWAGF